MTHEHDIANFLATWPELAGHGCSWYSERINVVPFGYPNKLPAQFTSDPAKAAAIVRSMLAEGAETVHLFDTVDGALWSVCK